MHTFSSSAPLLRLESLLSQAELNALLYGQWPDHPMQHPSDVRPDPRPNLHIWQAPPLNLVVQPPAGQQASRA